MTVIERYAITLPGTPGAHAPPRVVTVLLSDRVGVDGRPVYVDETGEFLVQIGADGVAEPLADDPGPCVTKCLHAVPLPGPR
ncbi:DUF6296 family protein [Kitasatospora mediocidica]|uniref:DUF6296 family protein n=1 Tax=Kitasatospora mediocidica TaxID=58352 RepID=UPI00056BB434|nr:DUF6296 family protein [Kitasatospora mediocidica]